METPMTYNLPILYVATIHDEVTVENYVDYVARNAPLIRSKRTKKLFARALSYLLESDGRPSSGFYQLHVETVRTMFKETITHCELTPA